MEGFTRAKEFCKNSYSCFASPRSGSFDILAPSKLVLFVRSRLCEREHGDESHQNCNKTVLDKNFLFEMKNKVTIPSNLQSIFTF